MATALDLLMSTKEDVNLLSEESDICTIDAKTRAIFVPSTIVVGGVQSDKNAERIKFSCPKIVGDNLDLSKFSVRINFENVSSVDFNVSIKDQYICDDVAVDGENVTFSWLIGRNAARYMGTVRFIVCAVKTDSDSNISVEWNTAIAEVPVLEGIEIDQPQIGEEEKDVINQLLELTKNTSAEAVQNVNSAKEQAIKDIQSVSQPDTTLTIEGGLAEAKATGEAIGSLKEDIKTVISENGYIIKPIIYVKDNLNQGFNVLGNVVSGKRYNIVYTPYFSKNISFGIMDSSGALHDTQDGQKYHTVIESTSDGRLVMILQTSSAPNAEVFVYDTTDNDEINNFINDALLLTNEIKYKSKNRQCIHLDSSMGEGEIVVKLTGACNIGNIDIHFDGGVYNFNEWYNHVYYMNEANAFRCEIPIGNGCNYFFNGSIFNASIVGLVDKAILQNCSLFGSRTNKGSYSLYNGIINVKGCIYVIHDEMFGKDTYTHEYHNMILNYETDIQTSTLRKCIGGGAGRNGTIVIDNCILQSDYSHELSFHGYGNILGDVDGSIFISIMNSYFAHGIQVDKLPSKEKGSLLVVSNSMDSNYYNYMAQNWENKSWNNVSRT